MKEGFCFGFGAYMTGLSVEKWFVIGGWPDTTAIPAIITSIAALVAIVAAAAFAEARA